MIGDVNLYLNDEEDAYNGEIEIMIAEKSAQRKGFATQAVQMMMAFGIYFY